jgi:hypothetical protein
MTGKQIGAIISTLIVAVSGTGVGTWYTKSEVDKEAVAAEVRAQMEPVIQARVDQAIKDRETAIVKSAVERVHLEESGFRKT